MENNIDVVRFKRRLEEFNVYMKENPIYIHPCDHATNAEEFVDELSRDILNELYEIQIDYSEELVDVAKNYLNEVIKPLLIQHYNSKCL